MITPIIKADYADSDKKSFFICGIVFKNLCNQL